MAQAATWNIHELDHRIIERLFNLLSVVSYLNPIHNYNIDRQIIFGGYKFFIDFVFGQLMKYVGFRALKLVALM